MSTPRLPGWSDRIAILGRTGSGKTVAGIWHLSNFDLRVMPFVVVDFKGDPGIAKLSLPVLEGWSLPPQGKGGAFVIRPLPGEMSEVEAWLWSLWERGRCGLFVDEGYLLKDSEAFNAILMQGRTKKIPVITLSQRPVWLPRAVWSESSFFQVFALNDLRDRQTVSNFVHVDFSRLRLNAHESIYYDVGRDLLFKFSPVPDVPRSRKKLLDTSKEIVFV